MRATTCLLSVVLLSACKKAEQPPLVERDGLTPGSQPWKIHSAREAAPADVSGSATVRDGGPTDSVPKETLARGENGWTCYPDDPATPAPDPVCLDENMMAFVAAYRDHKTPALTGMAIAYAMKGGVTPSDTDPYKAAPDSGKPWLQDPPMIIIAMPNSRSYAGLPTTRRSDGPWVKYAGTPYAFIVVPAGAAAGAAGPR